ncbi:leucine-rich repeat transmembrane protein kinase [Tripterygium wilfordii]|uniref:non-specific serine/threonine protein kinase n=1 Tax=Tripterygium wilfordii TaxID=458696 RepID=A0A7J7D983_TRIWF|nr:pollen receptor-like kinase 1 [Tripterygium wilfordii]KAF5742925.1 leucine-rich repeat transmembrane protein kinase [Tripterygium wilfordii]
MPSKFHHPFWKLSPYPKHCSLPSKGAHAAPTARLTSMAMINPTTLFLMLVLVLSIHFDPSHGLSDPEILLKFKSSLSVNNNALSTWTNQTPPCDGNKAKWVGILCYKGSIWGIKLERLGLGGTIDLETLKQLPNLRTLSFMHNNFEGPLPELSKLGALKAVYLSDNKFSGEIPGDAFEGMPWLKKLHLAKNEFTGAIPASLATLPKLLDLKLQENQFNGKLPEFQQKQWRSFNVSNNQLEGPIPAALTKMETTSFSGNRGLCGGPLSACSPATSSPIPDVTPADSDHKKPSGIVTIVILAIVVGVALAAIIAAIVILRRRNQASQSIETSSISNHQTKPGIKDSDQVSQGSPAHSLGGSKKGDKAKLSFVRDDRVRFDLQDLLKASAEILGSGCFGSSYKAALLTGPVMVVKRFKQMNNVGREEFQEHVRRLGWLRHPNLLPLVAYYYRKEEKLLISDHVEHGSLAVSLHGHQALGRPSLNWPSRLKIVKGVARGLTYLYKELPGVIAAHGHLKSSNVLLNNSFEPQLTDYGLIPLINQENAQELMVAYKSPEYSRYGRVTKKTDVWSLGILILEILTGKFPSNFLQQGKGSDQEDLATWVTSVVGDQEPTSEVFDKDLVGSKTSEGEMIKLLKIALACCEGDVEKRLDLKEAMERIEEIKERDGDNDFFSSSASDHGEIH